MGIAHVNGAAYWQYKGIIPLSIEPKFPDYEDLGNGKDVRIIEEIHYKYMREINGEWVQKVYIVPNRFKTDFASVPWLFRLFFPRFGRWNKAAILHDHIGRHETMPKLLGDQLFYAFMRHCRVNAAQAGMMYRAVRVGGGGDWWPVDKKHPY